RLQGVEGGIQANEYLLVLRIDRAGGRHGILSDKSVKDVARTDPKGRNASVGKLDKDTLRLLSDDVDLLDSRNVQQILAHCFCLPRDQANRESTALQPLDRE